MLPPDIDVLWAVVVGSALFLTLAGTLVVLVVLGQRRHIRYQERMLEKLATEVSERGKAQDELKTSEERYRNLVENINEMYCVLDGNSVIAYASPSMLHQLAREDRDVVGKPFALFIDRRDRKRITAFYADCVERNVADTTCVFRLAGKKGDTLWVELITRIERDGSGAVVEFRNVLRDVTERKRAEMIVRTLSHRIVEAQEEERRRVARDLHDGIIQLLSSIQFRLQSSGKELSGKTPTSSVVTETAKLLDGAIQEIRRISHNLRPSILDDLGLTPALRNICEEFSAKTKIKVDFQSPENMGRLPEKVELTLFRSIQEALSNVEKHARATQVILSIEEKDGFVQAFLQDNGRGFSPRPPTHPPWPQKGMGLDGMKERVRHLGGSVEISSWPRKGVKVLIRLPRKGSRITEP